MRAFRTGKGMLSTKGGFEIGGEGFGVFAAVTFVAMQDLAGGVHHNECGKTLHFVFLCEVFVCQLNGYIQGLVLGKINLDEFQVFVRVIQKLCLRKHVVM